MLHFPVFDVAQGFATIDADLMSLLHLSPRSIFNIGANDPTYADVEVVLDETSTYTRYVPTNLIDKHYCVHSYRGTPAFDPCCMSEEIIPLVHIALYLI